jgi:hypothetical protein
LLTFVPSQRVLGKHTHPFSPTHNQQTDTGISVRQRLRTTTTSRQRSKLAEGSQEGEKGSEKWKMGDKTQGGEVKKTLVKKNFGEKKLWNKMKWLVRQ